MTATYYKLDQKKISVRLDLKATSSYVKMAETKIGKEGMNTVVKGICKLKSINQLGVAIFIYNNVVNKEFQFKTVPEKEGHVMLKVKNTLSLIGMQKNKEQFNTQSEQN